MQYAQRFFRPIQDLSEKYNILQSAMAAGERVFKLLDTHAEIALARSSRSKADGPGRIEFDHVWFAYRTVAEAGRSATRSDSSTISRRKAPANPTGSSATSASPSNPARPSPSSDTPAPAKPP